MNEYTVENQQNNENKLQTLTLSDVSGEEVTFTNYKN